MKKKLTKKLEVRILAIMLALSVVLCMLTIYIAFQSYKKQVETNYLNIIYGFYLNTAKNLDLNHLTQPKDSQAYQEEIQKLKTFSHSVNTELKDIFIYADGQVHWLQDSDYILSNEALNQYLNSLPKEKLKSSTSINNKEQPLPHGPTVVTPDGEKIPTFYVPITEDTGTAQGLIGVINRGTGYRYERMTFVGSILVAALPLVLITTLLFFFYTRKRITRPILNLTTATEQFQNTDLITATENHHALANLGIKTGDEIEALSHQLEVMGTSLIATTRKRLDDEKQKQWFQSEMRAAEDVQHSMLPLDFPKDLELYASMDPAIRIGGDYYDFYFIDDSHLALTIADVSGKGIPAALFMALSKTVLKFIIGNGESLATALEKANEYFCKNDCSGMFVTVFAAILNLDTGELRYVNAGHNPPLIRSSLKEDYNWIDTPPDMVLAVLDGQTYTEYTCTLAPGGSLFLYTDGVTEAQNTLGGFYGEDRLLEKINAPETKDLPTKELLTAIKSDIDHFAGNAPQADDITLLGLKLKKTE